MGPPPSAAALCSLFLITLYPPASAAGAFRKSQELKTDSSARNDTRMYGEAQNPLHDEFNIEIRSQPRYNIDQHLLEKPPQNRLTNYAKSIKIGSWSHFGSR